jgi:hypothetical protein
MKKEISKNKKTKLTMIIKIVRIREEPKLESPETRRRKEA